SQTSSPSAIETTEKVSPTATSDSSAIPAESNAFASDSPTRIQPKSSPTSSDQETDLLSPTFTSQEEAIPGESNAFAPPSPTTIQPKEDSPTSITEDIQPRLENPNLNIIKPLGTAKPLAQQADFITSELISDFIDKSPSNSPETPTSSSSDPDNLPNISRSPDNDSKSTAISVPDAWSNISELLGETHNNSPENIADIKPLGLSKPLTNANNLISPSFSNFNGEQSFSSAATENEASPSQDIPNSWSSISELLGENRTSKKEDEFAPLSLVAPETSSPSYSLSSPIISDSSAGEISHSFTSPASEEISQQPRANTAEKGSKIEDEQLEMLAQKVYTLLRQRLEIDLERQGKGSVGSPIWLSNITTACGTSNKVKSAPKKSNPGQKTADNPGEVSPADDKLQKLTREVYHQIRQRLEIDRERQGRYYSGRVNW
ncbi:MAG TPA: hypothetical protein DCZ55_38020, partial [Cyanobacteria bacterium UBA11371]|nr:hypothetical protein [Cyanobacteria bacterium UBA11371]